jgi:hypothetical protein
MELPWGCNVGRWVTHRHLLTCLVAGGVVVVVVVGWWGGL